MARKRLPYDIKAYGTFLVNYLNCKLKPPDISDLANESFTIMENYLGYNRSTRTSLEIKRTYYEVLSETGFLKNLMHCYFRLVALGGFHPYKDQIFNETRLNKLKKLFKEYRELNENPLARKINPNKTSLLLYFNFAILRKNFRRIINKVICGETIEQIRNDPYWGDFILQLQSEYFDLVEQIQTRGNQVIVIPTMTDLPNNSKTFKDFQEGFLFPCLSYCFIKFFNDEVNSKRISKCNNTSCKKYIFSETLHARKFCDARCKSQYQHIVRDKKEWSAIIKNYRRAKKEGENRNMLELEIKRLMNSTGYSRKEVEEMLREDGIM
ncbi:hypothetical protein ACFLZT_00855 [Thermodesulfobacteriota bacterium]